MKKLLSTIALLTCVLGLTACGSSKEGMTQEEKLQYKIEACDVFGITTDFDKSEKEALDDYSSRNWDELSKTYNENGIYYEENSAIYEGVQSWWNAVEEIGEYDENQILYAEIMLVYEMNKDLYDAYGYGVEDLLDYYGADASKAEEYLAKADEITVVSGNSGIAVNLPVSGSDHDVIVEVLFDEDHDVQSVTANVSYSFGEKMSKAGLNTLMGIGTVFIVLILISLIISAFAVIPKIQNALANKNKPADVKSDAVDNTIAQIAEREEEELADDLEIVAVISAAIAASEGTSTDGFVVRSIRRRR